MKAGAVIVSAGRGKRLAKGDKALLNLGGEPLFSRALKTFTAIKEIREIVLVLRKSNFSLAKKFVTGKKVSLTEGGTKRADSVFKGLSALSDEVDYVLIHDAARPFVSKKVIFGMLKELKKHPAVICGLKCPDTIKVVKQGCVKRTLSREGVYLIQTPQGFKKKVIVEAYRKSRGRKFTPLEVSRSGKKRTKLLTGFTDDAQLLEAMGRRVKVIAGDIFNFKITYLRDFQLAGIIANERL
jgi:2-C-methyl-D-erythritol 4-phosphate cytidylyltransferase